MLLATFVGSLTIILILYYCEYTYNYREYIQFKIIKFMNLNSNYIST